jgi:hypothetical protein
MAHESDGQASGCVVGLLSWSSPATILRGVRAVIVDAIKTTAGWFLSHIREKGNEIGPPSRTDFYASTSVSVIFRIVLVVTPTLHVLPDAVFRSTA